MSNITTPQELQTLEQQLETVKNRITASEGEVLRLQKLTQAETYTVNEMVKAKKYNEDEIAKLEAQKTELTTELESLATDLTDAKKLIAKASEVKLDQEASQKKLDAAWSELDAARAAHEQGVAAREKEQASRDADLDKKTEQFTIRKQELEVKFDKIKQFAAELVE